MSKPARELDRALDGSSTTLERELAELVAIGDDIRAAYTSITPDHGAERAIFIGAVADRARPRRARYLTPVTVTAVLLFGLLLLGRTAMPDGTFYPVRQVLRSVGLAPASVPEVRGLLNAADRLLDKAEALDPRQIEGAERLAFEAIRLIGMAEGAFADLDVDEKALVDDELDLALKRAEAILTDEPKPTRNRGEDGESDVTDDIELGNERRRGSSAPGRDRPHEPGTSRRRDDDRGETNRGDDNSEDGRNRAQQRGASNDDTSGDDEDAGGDGDNVTGNDERDDADDSEKEDDGENDTREKAVVRRSSPLPGAEGGLPRN